MAQHAQLRLDAGIQIYFCDPRCPWQRGSNENTNGLLRQYFADSGEGGQCLRFKADSITVIADTCSRRRLQGSQVAIFSSSPDLVL